MMTDEQTEQRFKDIWLYCLLDHKRGGLHSGPCTECIGKFARIGPPDGRWNGRHNADSVQEES